MTDQPLLPKHAAEKPTDSASECPKTNADKPIFIITGLSGAGKSTVPVSYTHLTLPTTA